MAAELVGGENGEPFPKEVELVAQTVVRFAHCDKACFLAAYEHSGFDAVVSQCLAQACCGYCRSAGTF